LLKNPNWSAGLDGFSQSISGGIGAFGFQKIAKAPQSGIFASLRQTFALQKHFFNTTFGLTYISEIFTLKKP
jgi:hypothetical protein